MVRLRRAQHYADFNSSGSLTERYLPQPAPIIGGESAVPGGGPPKPDVGTGGGPIPPGVGPPVSPALAAVDKRVELTFIADRNQLYNTLWNAIADLAGKVKVTIRAESDTGFDKAKLQNGVLEPLREADLIE